MTPAMIWDTLKCLWKDRIPGQLVIQITDVCNARCPQCGMRVTETFPRSRISLGHIRQIIDAAAQKGIQAISFTGGEPFLLRDDLLKMIRYAGEAGIPYIRTGTNGFIFRGSHKSGFCARMEDIAGGLAQTKLRNLWISIDSAVPELHENMRGLSGVIDGIQKALPIFHRYGIYPSANLGINRNLVENLSGDVLDPVAVYHHYRSGFERFYQMICDMGFTTVNCCYPMSIDATESETGLSPVYAATATDNLVNFSRLEQLLLYRALFDTIPQYRSRIRIFTPRTSLLALIRQLTGHCHEPSSCRGGIDFFFIDAKKAHVWPCGYRGAEDLGPFPDLNPADLLKKGPHCTACHWECFRDPSELMGPTLDMLHRPKAIIKRLISDPDYCRLWLEDMRYYRACSFFDGRKSPEWGRMKSFDKPVSRPVSFPGRVSTAE